MDAINLNPPRTRRRRYSREFKTQIVEACKQPGTSVAAIARMHDINDNIVHRWLGEAEQSGSNLWPSSPSPAKREPPPASVPFVPVQVANTTPDTIHLELIRNDPTLRIDWPASQAQPCLQMLLALLR